MLSCAKLVCLQKLAAAVSKVVVLNQVATNQVVIAVVVGACVPGSSSFPHGGVCVHAGAEHDPVVALVPQRSVSGGGDR